MHVTTGKLRVHLERIKPTYLTLAAAFLGAAFFSVSVMLVAFEREIEMLCVVLLLWIFATLDAHFLKGVRGRRHYLVEFSLKGGSETSCWGRDSFFGLQALIKNEGWILARYRRSFQFCVFSHWGSFPLFAFVALLSCSFVCSFLHPFLSSTHEKRDSIQNLPFFTKNRDFTHNVKNLGQR